MNSVTAGLTAGLLVPLLVVSIFYWIAFPGKGVVDFFGIILSSKKLSALISLCVVPDLGVFFIFIWLNYLYSARGVLAAVFIFAFVAVLIKFA